MLKILQDLLRNLFEKLRNVLSGPEEVSRGYAGSEESLNAPENPDESRRGSEVSRRGSEVS